MRELKFRAWDKEMCHFIEHDELFETGPDYQNPFTRTDIVMLQSTGLTDKHGQEIYEGDILSFETLQDQWEENPDWESAVVEFRDGAFILVRPDGHRVRQWDDGCHDWYSIENIESFKCEVIGNIYENPELLEEL